MRTLLSYKISLLTLSSCYSFSFVSSVNVKQVCIFKEMFQVISSCFLSGRYTYPQSLMIYRIFLSHGIPDMYDQVKQHLYSIPQTHIDTTSWNKHLPSGGDENFNLTNVLSLVSIPLRAQAPFSQYVLSSSRMIQPTYSVYISI